MKFCIYYNEDTGEIDSFMRLLDSDIPSSMLRRSFIVVTDEPTLDGFVTNGQFVKKPRQPSGDHTWDTQTKAWVFDEQVQFDRIAKLIFDSLDSIDQAAGQARMRYITSVPGQSETYQRKEQQAREWRAAGYAGDAPVFVAAEAAALEQDPVEVADYILATADQWGAVKGPQIEAARRKWKVAIERAGSDELAVKTAATMGIAELMTL